MLAPVAQQLRRNGHEVIFLALTTAMHYLAERKIECIGFRDILPFCDEKALIYGEALMASLPTGGSVPRSESVAYMGLCFSDLVADVGEAQAQALFDEKGRHAFLPLRTMRKVMAHFSPDVVVATNSPRAERAAMLAAGECGIPAVCVVDLFALQEIQWVGQAGYGQRICVINEDVRQMFLEYGRSAEEVVVTGNPSYDVLMMPEVIEAGAALKRSKGWDDGRITVLWGSQEEALTHAFTGKGGGDPSLPVRIEEALRALVRDNEGFRLVVRYHPSQKWEFRPQANVEFSPVTEELASLLHAVDMVIVITSTVGLQAYIIGRPVISVDASLYSEDAQYARMGVSTGVKEVEELPGLVKKLAQQIREGVQTAVGAQYGSTRAVENVVRVIEGFAV